MGARYDSSGKPILTDWLHPDSDEKKKVCDMKNKALFIVLLKRHLRAIVYRWRKLFLWHQRM